MTILIIALLALGILAAIIYKVYNKDGDDTTTVSSASTCSACDGTKDKCEQECMMEAATKEIEYYDDEELDTYKGRPSDRYTDDEAEQFRDVLYTMRQSEVAAWNRSLIMREINIPDQLKDEVVMLIGD